VSVFNVNLQLPIAQKTVKEEENLDVEVEHMDTMTKVRSSETAHLSLFHVFSWMGIFLAHFSVKEK